MRAGVDRQCHVRHPARSRLRRAAGPPVRQAVLRPPTVSLLPPPAVLADRSGTAFFTRAGVYFDTPAVTAYDATVVGDLDEDLISGHAAGGDHDAAARVATGQMLTRCDPHLGCMVQHRPESVFRKGTAHLRCHPEAGCRHSVMLVGSSARRSASVSWPWAQRRSRSCLPLLACRYAVRQPLQSRSVASHRRNVIESRMPLPMALPPLSDDCHRAPVRHVCSKLARRACHCAVRDVPYAATVGLTRLRRSRSRKRLISSAVIGLLR
jgi:hypothetical protein